MRQIPKVAYIAASCVAALAVIGLLVLMTGAFDIVERSYPNRETAFEDDAFDRGWLPEFIPQSATNILVKRNRDVCITDGSFDFWPNDFEAFTGAIRSSDNEDRKIRVAFLRQKELVQAGYRVYEFNHRGGCATFLIHPELGRCEFTATGSFASN